MAVSPMMQQYQDAKAACPGAVLFFRMGDFYELFFDDAKLVARVLNLALTSRDKGENPTPMAGFPHHQLESYLGKLIAGGYRVAVCEQMEDPKAAKGIVKREVTRIVSPGTVTDDALLDPRESNYLAAIAGDEPVGLAWIDLSTGRFAAEQIPASRLNDELARIGPVELLAAEEAPLTAAILNSKMLVTRRPPWAFGEQASRDALCKHFQTRSLDGFGFNDDDGPAIRAAGAILDYLLETQKSSLGHVDKLTAYRTATTLEIDEATRRSLEITRSMRDGKREGTLLSVLDRTVTAMGARRLADWTGNPLVEPAEIEARHDAVGEFFADETLVADLRASLQKVYDVERLLARVSTNRATPRDLSFLNRTLRGLPAIKAKLTARSSSLLNKLENALDLLPDLRTQLDAALEDDCPLVSKEGGFVRTGYDPRLDEFRKLSGGGKQWIAQYQADEQTRTGIPSLKVGFNSVFGYFIEITNTHRDKVPANYIRKQTVKNAERYITPELKEYEEKVLTADQQSKDLEYELFLKLRDLTAAATRRLMQSAGVLADLDALCSLANLARERNYCRPKVVAEPILKIVAGRHPVLDAMLPQGQFVPNDVSMSPGGGMMMLITGPNMAGKSTYIRQAALLTLMAQIGSFVPAQEATIGIADRIYARVGASDELSRGQSTFMVEMTETARILNGASARSLVILDEIGRGTSTYDGVSLAWAVVEYLHEHVGCRTLFATHYHELCDLRESLAEVRNLNVAVREWQDEVVFLHQIVPGAADKSYGIHVARLAGVPRQVLDRANDILKRLEHEHVDEDGKSKLARKSRVRVKQAELQMTLFAASDHPVVEELKKVNLDEVAPINALNLLRKWQDSLNRDQGGS